MKQTNVYLDSFNLYYGCIRGTPYRWLDLAKLCRALLPSHSIGRIRYFTAIVQARPGDPQQPERQQTYLRALETIPNLSIHYGHFLSHVTRLPLAHPPAHGPQTVEVVKTEEKGSDVNLATCLLVDGFNSDYEAAVVISNDTDLLEPIKFVRQQLGCSVGILNPQRKQSRALAQVVTFYKRIRTGVLRAGQLPPTLTDTHGTITKPAAW